MSRCILSYPHHQYQHQHQYQQFIHLPPLQLCEKDATLQDELAGFWGKGRVLARVHLCLKAQWKQPNKCNCNVRQTSWGHIWQGQRVPRQVPQPLWVVVGEPDYDKPHGISFKISLTRVLRPFVKTCFCSKSASRMFPRRFWRRRLLSSDSFSDSCPASLIFIEIVLMRVVGNGIQRSRWGYFD